VKKADVLQVIHSNKTAVTMTAVNIHNENVASLLCSTGDNRE
jgi:hypothetical protein